jgi:hypothetical protein
VASPAWAIHVVSAIGGEDRVYQNGGPPRAFSSDWQDRGANPPSEAGSVSGIVFLDGSWVAFQARPVENDSNRTIYLTNCADGQAGSWIQLTDGGMLYFLSERDGFGCIWAERVDPKTKHPSGDPFPVYHFHHSQQSLTSLGSTGSGIVGDRGWLTLQSGKQQEISGWRAPGSEH